MEEEVSSPPKQAQNATHPTHPPLAPSNNKRPNLGRAARRRRRKERDIQQQLVALSQGTYTAPVSVLPDDRQRVGPAVEALRKKFEWSDCDDSELRAQLGYVPGNAVRVAARWKDYDPTASNNAPVVLQLYPLAYRRVYEGGKTDGRSFKGRKRMTTIVANSAEDEWLIEPFPTIYWLTHPLLHTLVSQLEVQGFGKVCEDRLQHDPHALSRMQRAHDAYREERLALWNASSPAEEAVAQHGFLHTGIAGMRNPAAVKCLHAHTAHFLSGCANNLTGAWVLEELRQGVAAVETPP